MERKWGCFGEQIGTVFDRRGQSMDCIRNCFLSHSIKKLFQHKWPHLLSHCKSGLECWTASTNVHKSKHLLVCSATIVHIKWLEDNFDGEEHPKQVYSQLAIWVNKLIAFEHLRLPLFAMWPKSTPVCIQNNCNVGYGFINFVDTKSLLSFYLKFNKYTWQRYKSEKVWSVLW